jgi:hypothetical protein
MTNSQFEEVKTALDKLAAGEKKDKQKAYTNGNKDVLTNFKRIGKRLNLDPLKVWAVYFNKHVDAINTYCDNRLEAEPIDTRFADALNYLYLGIALIKEETENGIKGQVSDPVEQGRPEGRPHPFGEQGRPPVSYL